MTLPAGAGVGWSAADCLTQRAELAAEIARVRERDANGHVAHAIVAALAIFMQPIANAPANIGFGMLVAMCALRVHRLWRVWALMFRDWFWVLLVAWAAWTGVTLAWSEDFDYGFRQWTAFRAILWVPMLWPVIDRWRWLVGALLAGVACANAIQISQMVWKWPPVRELRRLGTGFHHPSYMGTWCAVAFALWTMVAVASRPAIAVLALVFATCAAVGIVVSGTRGAVTGALVEVVLIGAIMAVSRSLDLRRVMLRTVMGAVIIVVVWATVGEFLTTKFRQVVVVRTEQRQADVRARADADRATTGTSAARATANGSSADALPELEAETIDFARNDPRVVIWMFALRQWPTAPIAGTGYGSTFARSAEELAANPGLPAFERKGLGIRHPHSLWIQALSECGVIGFLLIGSWSIGTLISGWRALKVDPTANTMSRRNATSSYLVPGLLGALVAWIVASQFDGYQMNSVALAMGMIASAILIGLGLRPSLHRAGATR